MSDTLIKGPIFSFPSLLEDACHMAINGIIAVQAEGCIHGQVGECEQIDRGPSYEVADIDHENGVVTFDLKR